MAGKSVVDRGRLLAAAGDDNHREIIAAARARVVEIARRREPTKAMS